MALTNVERRAAKRIRRQNRVTEKRPREAATETARESVKTRWTPEQIANFERRIGPIPVDRK